MSARETKPTICAVIPVRDREQWIGRAIRSVLAQTRAPDEVLVVDDGSRDGTAAAVREVAGEVRLIEQPGSGAAAARNRGVAEASSDWIAFLDSDDTWDPGHLERMSAALQATGGSAGLYFADTVRPAEENGARLWELADFEIEGNYELCEDGTAWVMSSRQPMMLQSSLFDREAYLGEGGLDPGLTRRHDTHLFFCMGLGKPLCAVAGVGAVMTNDAAAGRLTVTLGGESKTYWSCTEALYADVLKEHSGLAGDHRRDLQSRLAAAHRRLCRFELSEHRFLRASSHCWRALRLDPRSLGEAIARRLLG